MHPASVLAGWGWTVLPGAWRLAPRAFGLQWPHSTTPGVRSLLGLLVALFGEGGVPMSRLLEQHYPQLLRLARRMARSLDQAQELAQETALAAMQARSPLRSEHAFVAWCRTAMLHALLQHQRRVRREALVLQPLALHADSADSPSPDDPLEQACTRTDLVHALRTLPEPVRRTFVLVDWLGLDYQAAARAAGVPVGTVRSRVHRARAHLRRSLLGPPSAPAAPPS